MLQTLRELSVILSLGLVVGSGPGVVLQELERESYVNPILSNKDSVLPVKKISIKTLVSKKGARRKNVLIWCICKSRRTSCGEINQAYASACRNGNSISHQVFRSSKGRKNHESRSCWPPNLPNQTCDPIRPSEVQT
jgi:hypothetical protein